MSEFYPGSKQRRAPSLMPSPDISPFDGVKPRIYQVSGTMMEFFTVGQLAAALGRSSVTLRRWEHTGIIPRATFQAPNPRRDHRARRRLYTRAQAEGIVRIAREEGLLDHPPPAISSTRFSERVTALFQELLLR